MKIISVGPIMATNEARNERLELTLEVKEAPQL